VLIKSIIFDFDGVIVNSTKIKDQAFKKIVEIYPKQNQLKFINFHKKNLGISRVLKFKYLYKTILKKSFSKKDIDKLSDKFQKIVYKKIIKLKVSNGLKKFIKYNSKKYDLYISSGTPENELKKIMSIKKIDKNFKNIYGSPSTKSQHIKKIIKNDNIKNDNIIFVGDGLSDYKAARVNKIKFIQVGKNFKMKSIKYKITYGCNINKIIERIKN